VFSTAIHPTGFEPVTFGSVGQRTGHTFSATQAQVFAEKPVFLQSKIEFNTVRKPSQPQSSLALILTLQVTNQPRNVDS
jgi:hypothetical protein